jgi:hypothetical protein
MSFGFGGGVGEGGMGLGVGGGIGEGGIGSGDGAGTGSGGIGCGGNGSMSGDSVMESDSARQWNDMRSANTNWAVTATDTPHMILRVLIDIDQDPFVAFIDDGPQNPRPSPRLTILCSASSQSSRSYPFSRPRCSYSA